MPDALEKLVAVAGELAGADKRVESLMNQASELEKSLASRKRDAEKQAKALLSDAEKQSKLLLFDARKKEEALAAREKDVVSREKAVAWIDEKLKELAVQEKDIKAEKAALAKARGQASAAKDTWIERQSELDALAAELAKKAPEKVKKIMDSSKPKKSEKKAIKEK